MVLAEEIVLGKGERMKHVHALNNTHCVSHTIGIVN